MAENSLIRIGGMWVQEDKNGRKFMSGHLSSTSKLLLFRNEKKNSENDPDYILYMAAREPRKSGRQQESNRQNDEFLG